MKNWMKYLSAGMLSLLLAVSVFVSCSDETGGGEGTSAATATGTVEEISGVETTEDSADGPTDGTNETAPDVSDATSTPVTNEPETDAPETAAPETDPAEETTSPLPDTIRLTFEGSGLNGAPEGSVVVEDNAFTIVCAGTYELTGNLTGQLRVRVEKTERVTLIFNNFTAYSSVNAPIYLVSADKVVIQLAEGSVNRLTDAKTYQFSDPAETKPNACLYAGCDLKIKGKGTLIVEGNYNNGIGCKKDLEITNGIIQVSAPNNIIKGNNSVTISGGELTLSGGEDAIKSDEEVKQGKGYILISEDAVIDITCSDDALQAAQAVTVEATVRLTVSCGGDLVNCPGTVNVADSAVTMKP